MPNTPPELVLLRGAEVFAPAPLGVADVLIAGGRIARVGPVDGAALARAGLEVATIDAAGCAVVPGLVDVHEHLCGGSGEPGFAQATPEIQPRELVRAGITTVVGCLGADTTTRSMPQLLARVKALRAVGLSAWCWTGGYPVPPATLTGSVRSDVLLIDEVVGLGELAIADARASEASPGALAALVREAAVAGMLAGKAGRTHFHVGDEGDGLAVLRRLVERHAVRASWLYPTHVERREQLFAEAVAFAAQDAFVDVDVWERDLAHWLARWRESDGRLDRLTASSDAGKTCPSSLTEEVRRAVVAEGLPLPYVLATVTANPAAALALPAKGRIAVGADADVLVVDRGTLALRDVVAGGRVLMRDGALAAAVAPPIDTRLGAIDDVRPPPEDHGHA